MGWKFGSAKALAAVLTFAVATGILYGTWSGLKSPPLAPPSAIITTPPGWVRLDEGSFTLYAPEGSRLRKGRATDSTFGYIVGPAMCARFQIGLHEQLVVSKEQHPDYSEGSIIVDGTPGILRKAVLSTSEQHLWFPSCGSPVYLGLLFEHALPGGDSLSIEGTAPDEEAVEDVLRMYKTIRFANQQ